MNETSEVNSQQLDHIYYSKILITINIYLPAVAQQRRGRVRVRSVQLVENSQDGWADTMKLV